MKWIEMQSGQPPVRQHVGESLKKVTTSCKKNIKTLPLRLQHSEFYNTWKAILILWDKHGTGKLIKLSAFSRAVASKIEVTLIAMTKFRFLK
jgi:hypothetical protein